MSFPILVSRAACLVCVIVGFELVAQRLGIQHGPLQPSLLSAILDALGTLTFGTMLFAPSRWWRA